MNPIVDNCDFVVYVKGNGLDDNKKVIKSSAYLASTDKFFARSRFEHVPTFIEEFNIENLENAIKMGIDAEEKETGIKSVSYAEQKEQNISKELNFDEIMTELETVGRAFANANQTEILINTIEDTLGAGRKISDCTKRQVEALAVILDDLKDKALELGIEI